jgi:putative FmdB family regulatory protein
MPLYEYECPKCGRKFELRRGMQDNDADIECPACGAKSPRRLLSRFAAYISSADRGPTGVG